MTVDPDLIHARSHTEIGTILQRDGSVLIERWTRRAIQEQPQARRIHHDALLDHLHELLISMGRSLAESSDSATSQHSHDATVHGEQRWDAGWSLTEVVLDYQILRLVIIDYLEETLDRPLESREVMAIGLVLDEAISASVAMYSQSRDEYLRQLQAERTDRDRQIQENLRKQTEILAEVDRRKSEFLATLGHELRNPLAPLWHVVELQELWQTTEPVAAQVRDIIKRQVQQLSRLADDLLDVSRIAQNKVELRKEPVELEQVMKQAVQTSMPHLKARRHRLEVAFPSEPVWLNADPDRLVQVLVNLLNNAAKYTEPGGEISLSGELQGGDVVLRVRDTGMGIPPKLLPHVFELFTQAHWPDGESQGGMGIGLALVRRLVELHGGTITASSAGVGQGSEFAVTLPVLTDLAGAQTESEGRAQAPRVREALAAQRRKILVVDDNVDAAESLSMLLSVEGHEVQVAFDGVAALQSAASFQPEVVILDLGLPRMNGLEVARRMRQESEHDSTLLVALSGYGQEDDRRRSLECGFNAHLVKPVDLDVLRETLAHSDSLLHRRTSM